MALFCVMEFSTPEIWGGPGGGQDFSENGSETRNMGQEGFQKVHTGCSFVLAPGASGGPFVTGFVVKWGPLLWFQTYRHIIIYGPSKSH